MPAGLVHGFCVLSETALFTYKCTEFYSPWDERGILWSDPNIGIEWPINDPLLSDKDEEYPRFKDLNPDHLPPFIDQQVLELSKNWNGDNIPHCTKEEHFDRL